VTIKKTSVNTERLKSNLTSKAKKQIVVQNIARHVMICKLSFVTSGRVDVNKAMTV
jgi:hypothetical protein